ncbi:unnamed protein product [Darwinula stevensoni]|uniref:AEBP2-like C-terminal SH3 domain-containing protein n=1 Tax=Darwinula stevensoni TaxID=69355 RepID=A0A7R9ADG7_9CRUS|nr:unnamed protein product [Darwinula stevensoni]CAG0901072.1 unnamed protein product [Darwinula stevensoni]
MPAVGCRMRERGSFLLERHVNGHFDGSGGSEVGQVGGGCGSGGGGAGLPTGRRNPEASPSKAVKKNGKQRLQRLLRKRPHPGRLWDFWELDAMDRLRNRLSCLASHETLGQVTLSGDACLTFKCQVRGRQVDSSGKTKALVHWMPENILPDEWVDASMVEASKSVPVRSLSAVARDSIHAALFGSASSTKRGRKSKRK